MGEILNEGGVIAFFHGRDFDIENAISEPFNTFLLTNSSHKVACLCKIISVQRPAI